MGLVSYNNEQLAELGSVLRDSETRGKRFALTVNFSDIRTDIAEVLAMFDEENVVRETPVVQRKVVRQVTKKQPGNIVDIANAYAKHTEAKRTAAVMVGAFTSLACVGALGVSAIKGRR